MKGPTPSSSGQEFNHVSFNAATNTWLFLGDINSNCMFYSTATPPVPATWVGIQRSSGTFTTQAWGAASITTPSFTSPINVARLDNKVTFPANRMLAVGGGGIADVLVRSANTPSPENTGTISFSDDDGMTWQMVPGGATNSMFSSQADISANVTFGIGGSRCANAVAWNGEKWVAAGNGRTNSLAFSDDGGMTWTGVTGKSIFSVEARDVTWNGQMWVAVGRGIAFSTAYSYDGVTWMGPLDASGAPVNVFSYDIAGPSASVSDISGGGNHVIWNGKMWVATGTRTLIAGSSPAAYYTIAYSTDGKTWTGVPDSGATNTGFDVYAHGIAWNGRNFVATGRGTTNTLVNFTDVLSGGSLSSATSSWVGLGNSVFSIWGRGITWGAKRWMATGCGTNTVAYSINGRNWQGCGANVFKPLRRFMAIGDTGVYNTVFSGQPQRGVAISYSDDGITWDAPIVNQGLELNTVNYSFPLSSSLDTCRSTIFTNNILISSTITDNTTQHIGLMYSSDGGASWARVPGSNDTEANGGIGMSDANGSYTLMTNSTRTRLLVGGGDSGNSRRKVYFSNDGFNWRNGITSPNSTQMAWVYASLWVGGSYNRWLIGGNDATINSNGRIMYSGNDGLSWTDNQPPITGGIITCFAANSDFSLIIAGSLRGSKIYRSINGGHTWSEASVGGVTATESILSIAFSPSLQRWVAVGGSANAPNTIIYSINAEGNSWAVSPGQAKTSATAIFKNGSEANRVIWDAVGQRFIVGGWNGQSVSTLTNIGGMDSANNNPGYTMAYSSDGINWTPITVRSSDDAGVGMGASSFGPFLTRCQDIIALDTNGDFTPANTGYSVSWNSYANRFVATGNGTTPVVYSNDGGVTWTPANQQPPQQAIVVAGGASAAAGTTTISPLAYTIDGKTWTQSIGAKEIFGTTGAVNAVRYGQTSTAISPNGRIWVAGGTQTSPGTSNLAFSQNGIRWTAIANGTTLIGNVRTIAYAPTEQLSLSSNAITTATSGVGNGVWVAGGDTTNSLIFSYDGISWSEVPNSLTVLTRCNACTFANGLFVVGGAAATGTSAVDTTANMFYSTDGINWRPVRNSVSRISASATIGSIAYGRDENGRGLWVAGAVGSSSISLLYSYNGMDWIGVINSGTTISSINVTGIAYGVSTTTGRGLWVATVHRTTAQGNAFVFSTNGRDGWTPVPNTKSQLFDVDNGGPTGISYLNGVWYATGSSAGLSAGRTLAYSYEGSSGWFGVYPTTNIYGGGVGVSGAYSLTDMRCVATTNDYVIPTGASAGSSVSSGTAATSFRPGSMTTVRSVGWTAGVGSGYLQHPTLLIGSDNSLVGTTTGAISADGGRTWGSSTVSIAQSAFRGGVCNDAFWNGTTWVAVGNDTVTKSKIATSKDGVTWTQLSSTSVPIAGVLNTVTWNGTIWMVGGDGSPINDLQTASFAWSTDLTSWNAISNTDISLTVVKRIAWNGMYWVAVGQGVNTSIMYSKNKNGLVWEDTFTAASSTTKTSALTTMVNDVVWGGGRWVAVGRGNSVSDGSGVSILYSVDTPTAGATSADYAISGRRWVGVAGSAQLFPYGANSIAWNGKRFIATGPASASCSTSNIIAWSADGISWNGYSTSKTVTPGQRWVAVGSGSRACIALSADGRVWTDVSGSALLFSDISGASSVLVNTMKTGARAVGWNGSSLIVGGARSATTVTASSRETANSSIGRTTIPVCAFIGSGNGVMGGGTTNAPMDATAATYLRVSSSVFITHMDVNIRESSAPYANMWLNTYTDLSGTQLFQVTPETQTFSSALKWNGWSWVANFGMTTNNPVTGEQYGSIWYCTDPLARVGWSVASNSANPRILIGQGGYAALEWNGLAWLACGYDPNNNNLIYTTDKYGAVGWTAVSGIVSGAGSASFQPVCIASSSRYWVVGGSQDNTSALYFTSDRTGASGWRRIMVGSVLPAIRISSVAYNGSAWVCCGGGSGEVGAPAASISWRADTGTENILTGWATATISGSNGGIPPILANGSAITFNAGVSSPVWVVVGDASLNAAVNQIAYTTTVDGSTEWKIATGTLTSTLFRRLNGIAWTGYSWIATSGAGSSRILSTMDITAATGWNSSPTNSIYTPTLCTNAVSFANIPISLLTTGMPTSLGAGAGTGAMWRGGVGRAQGLLTGGGTETTSVIARSANGAEGLSWSPVYSRNFLIAVGGGIIRDATNVGGKNRMAYSYDGGLSWTTNNTTVLTNAASNSIGSIRTVKYGNGIWVAGGDALGSSVSGNNCLAWSRDGVNWNGAGGTQIFGSAGSCYAVCCNDRGRWVAVGGSPLTTSGTYTNVTGSIYTMAWSDDGMNWTPILGSRALFGIVCQGVSYGADAAGVGMWTAIGRGSAYTGLAYSYDAKNWFMSQSSASLFGTSTNVLTERYAPIAADWRTVAINSTGQYQFAAANTGLVWQSMDYGVTWSALTLPLRNWVSVAVSSTGQYVIAASSDGSTDRLYNSSDYGVTWTGRGIADGDWKQVAISATGQYQVGVASSIRVSKDYGITWNVPPSGSGSWTGIAISSSGQYITAVLNTKPQISSDYGVSFGVGDLNLSTIISIAMSSTGQIQIAGTTGTPYVSNNYGVNWVAANMSGTNHRFMAISSTGQYRSSVIASTSDTIKRSNNFDSGWTSNGPSANYFAIAMSASGQYQTAVSQTSSGIIYISSNFGETWSAVANDSRSLGITYGKNLAGTGMWIATAGRRDRDVSANVANTMAYSYDGKLWRGITASAGLSEQAWSVAYGKDGFGVGMWVAAGYDTTCGLKWSYDGINWNASTGASGAAVWASMAAGRRAISVYFNGSMWLASTSDTRNGEPNGTGISANNASSVTGYLLYSYNGKNWLPVLAPNTYDATISTTAQPSIYSVLPNPVILDFGSFYDDQTQRGATIANTTSGKMVSAVASGGVPIENVNTIVPHGRGSLATGQVPFLLGGDSGLVERRSNTIVDNAYDNFIVGPTAQSTNNNWQYFEVNQTRTSATLLTNWQNGNPVIATYGQWDNNRAGDYPFIQKVTGSGTITATLGGGSFTGPALIMHPDTSDANNIGIGYKNNRGNTINVIVNIVLSLLLPANNTDGVNYYIQRGLVNDSRYQIYKNSKIPGKSTTNHTFYNEIELLPNEIIYLILNRSTEYFYDHTKVNFNVTTVQNTSIPITSEIAAATTSLSTSTDGGITWRSVPNSTRVMTKVNKILCDENTQQIVAVGTGNYSVATSTPAKAADADGWTGVFGSRMTDTRAGLFEKYGTGAYWFGGAKMWIASGRVQSRSGSSLAVSVNGTVWQDAKIVSQMAAGAALGGRGGGLTSRTTINTVNSKETTTVVYIGNSLYEYSGHTFTSADVTGYTGPTQSQCVAAYSSKPWASNTNYFSVGSSSTNSGYQYWTVPATGSYTIEMGGGQGGAIYSQLNYGIANGSPGSYCSSDVILTKGTKIGIVVGQTPRPIPQSNRDIISHYYSYNTNAKGKYIIHYPTDTERNWGIRSTHNSFDNESLYNLFSGAWGQAYGPKGIDQTGDTYYMIKYDDPFSVWPYTATVDNTTSVLVTRVDNAGKYSNVQAFEWRHSGGFDSTGSYWQERMARTVRVWTVPKTAVSDIVYVDLINPYAHGSYYPTTYTIPSTTQSSVIRLGWSVNLNTHYLIFQVLTTRASTSREVKFGITLRQVFGCQGGGGGGGSFVWNDTDPNKTLISAVGGGGGIASQHADFGNLGVWQENINTEYGPVTLNGNSGGNNMMEIGSGGSPYTNRTVLTSAIGTNGNGGNVYNESNGGYQAGPGAGWKSNGIFTQSANLSPGDNRDMAGKSFANGFLGGSTTRSRTGTGEYEGGFGGGGAGSTAKDGYLINSITNSFGGGGGGYSGGGVVGYYGINVITGGCGGVYTIGTNVNFINGNVYGNGYVKITPNFVTVVETTQLLYNRSDINIFNIINNIIPYTFSTTPLLTYTDSAAAFSTQVSSVATNSQYNSAVVGGSSVQFVAGGRGGSSGLAYSNDGQNWTAASAGTGTSAVFQSPTNATTRTGSGGFDASFGTVALTQRLTTPTTYPSGDFASVSVSKTGKYQTAVITNGNIWSSSDYGVTWTSRATALNWYSVSLSSTGQYQTAAALLSNIWTSSDYGVTWTSRATALNWYSVSLSSSGQYQSAVSFNTSANGYIYTSSDFGVTWTPRITDANRTWFSISVSSTGQYQSAVVYNTNDTFIYASSDYGVSWVKRGQSGTWTSISLSFTGQYQTAVNSMTDGYIYTSSDFGVTWTQRIGQTSRTWYSVSLSSTGQYQSAVVIGNGNTNAFIYISSDFGLTWTPRMTDINRGWRNISVSGTGQYQTACTHSGGSNTGNIWTSSDFGVTWVQRTTTTRTNVFTRIRTSASGQYQIATSGPTGNANGQLYVSTDYGETWTPRRGLGSWLGGAVSATGAIMMSFFTPTAATASIIRSTDYGNTISDVAGTTLSGSAYWQAISTTNSANIQTAVAYGGSIYRSTDSGATWSNTGITIDGSTTTNTTTPRNWQDVAVSAETGATQVTCVNGGYLYVSSNTGASWSSSVDFNGAGGIGLQSWKAAALSANGQYGLACVNGGYIYRTLNSGVAWVSSNIVIDGVGTQTTGRAWQDVGMSANGKYQVACSNLNIFYSKDYGASWFLLNAAGSRAWSSVALSENGSTISATTSDATGGVWVYAMPDDQYYQQATLTNSGSNTITSTVRAIAYGNSGTGAAIDGYWVAGADASANTLAYSSNGIDWTAVLGSKTTLFNSVNGVAYGSDSRGTPMWVAVGLPFVGSVPGVSAYSIAYSYNMTTWIGVHNTSNFTGQGNHVSYGQDEYGEGIWIAVGQSDGILAANLGNSSTYNSNGTTNTTIFYSYDGANWSAATGDGVFAVSGTDVTWGVDASGVPTWVATGVGYTNPLTGVFIPGGCVAYSTNGRVWTPIRNLTSTGLSATTLPATTRGHAMLAPPSSTGFIIPTYNNIWRMMGGDIDGEGQIEYSGISVSISADGTVVAIGANQNDGSGNNAGHVRVYKYNPNKTVAQMNQALPGFGPAGWDRLGGDIDGEQSEDQSGISVCLSADGTTVAIGARLNDGTTGSASDNRGHVRVYRYRADKTAPQFGNTSATATDFGPAGWDRLGGDIDGEALGDNSGIRVSISADGNIIAIAASENDGSGNVPNSGHVRVYKYTQGKGEITDQNSLLFGPVGWVRLGADIDGEAASDGTLASPSMISVALSADGSTVAIGAPGNDATNLSTDSVTGQGHVRVYKYDANKMNAQMTQGSANFGPRGWNRMGADIDGLISNEQSGTSVSLSADGTILAIGSPNPATGAVQVRIFSWNSTTWVQRGGSISGETTDDRSGTSVSLSADGNILAIGAPYNDVPTTVTADNRGHVRVYKYNAGKTAAITDQTLPNFGPVGWDRIGVDIDGEAPGDESGTSVSISADGTTLAIGSITNDGGGNLAGQVRVYKLDTFGAITYTSSNPAVAEIYGNAILLIKDIASGTTTITATQSAVSPFSVTPTIVQGTLTVTGTTYTLNYNNILSVYTPFTGLNASALTVAYGRNGSKGTGAPLWIVGGSGGTNVFVRSSRPSAVLADAWSVVASNAEMTNAPFTVCNSIGYSNGIWVAGNNTDSINVLARSDDGGITWKPITAASTTGIIAGSTAIGANAFCNYSLAYADYSSDTNLRSWVAIPGTKNFMFDGGVNAVETVTSNVNVSYYQSTGNAWWVAGGKNQFIQQQGQLYLQMPGNASIAYTTNTNGASGWILGTSTVANGGNGIIDLDEIRDIAFSPHTQQWLAVGVGSAATPTRTVLYSANGIAWTSTIVSSADASLNLNTCVWNQLDASASAAGRWLVGGTRSGSDSTAISLYISTETTGQSWTPIVGTGAILSQVYSLAYNGRVWIAAGTPATSNGSTSTLMRTTDPTGATGWQGIANTNVSTGGFDTAARSITWNADQQMWVATGENTGAATDASFSSVIYSLDVSGSIGTWRSVRETNSFCFSGEGTSIAFKGDKWFAAGQGTNQIVTTTGASAANAAAASWTPITHGTSITSISDIAYTGRRLIATGASVSGTSNGVILTTDNSGSVWTAAPATPGPGFSDAMGGGTSITFEPSYEGVGRAVATGRSAANTISVSTDGGVSWSDASVQYSTLDASSSAITQPLFTTGGNSVAYVGNDTLFAGGGNDVQWTGKRWVATGRNSATTAASVAATRTTTASTSAPLQDVINNNTSAVAISDDGITWQCVNASQGPNITDGTIIASNSRIGPTPLINSKIVITDGGDTEVNADYGGMIGGVGGAGTGVAQIDIISELTPVSTAASSVVLGAVNILGTGNNGGANGVGNASNASFDNTSFSITTRPL